MSNYRTNLSGDGARGREDVDPGPAELLWAMTRTEQQKDVAARLGISAQYLCDVLKGRREISAQLAKRLGYRRVVTFQKLSEAHD